MRWWFGCPLSLASARRLQDVHAKVNGRLLPGRMVEQAAIEIFDLAGNKLLTATLNVVFDDNVRELRAMYTSAVLLQRHGTWDRDHSPGEEVVPSEQFTMSGGLPAGTLGCASCSVQRFGALAHYPTGQTRVGRSISGSTLSWLQDSWSGRALWSKGRM